MKRILLLLTVALAFGWGWVRYNHIPLSVIGQPSSSGVLQRDKEAPFFANLGATTGIPLQITYKPLEQVGFKDNHQLQMLKDGMFDLVSLRFLQNSETEPSLTGIDLIGLIPDYEAAHKVVAAYSGTVDSYLQQRFKAKLLGIWTFGPQEIFCTRALHQLRDLAGRKVRVGSATLSTFVLALGGTPVVLPFDDTRNALSLRLIDCAITSAASANYAGWLSDAPFNFRMAVHFGLNGYVMSLNKWNLLSTTEKQRVQSAFDQQTQELWQFTQAVHADAHRCNTAGTCLHGTIYQGSATIPSREDVQLLRDVMLQKVLPQWAEKCERVHAGCMQEWKQKLFPLVQPA